uniref:Small-subunit processome Utp21 domain-containing protein n=1 Tax=Clytia hemisphaerica TaxID=252671 RepID=A0A7M5V3L5_9CNID
FLFFSKMIHEFKGWEEPVVVMEQSPAIDVIGIGLQSGHVILYNIKFEKKLMSFHQDFGNITSIAFRTDGQPVMATGSTIGHVTFWDLEKKRLITVLRHAHVNSVSGMKFLQRQPTMITSSPDNSLKMWIFDNPDGSARLLRQLSGHSSPPTKIHFYGERGHIVLTGGLDRSLRYSSIVRGLGCTELSQGSVISRANSMRVEVTQLKLPPITCIAAESARAYDWDNVVTCHLGHGKAHTWNSQNRCIGKYTFKCKSKDNQKIVANCCNVSSCGNFTVIGYDNGQIERYNLQSGLDRGSVKAHEKTIRGLHISSANFALISTSADKTIKFWRFKDFCLDTVVQCESAVAISKLHRESSLLAVAFDDYTIQIYDIDTKAVVRSFFGHRNVITDISWSLDARWLVSSSIDGTIKTWDVPTGRLIDCFLVEEAPTSVAFSPSGEMLASTHQDNVGIFLWANKIKYSGGYPTPLPNDFQPSTISLPQTIVDEQGGTEDMEGEESIETNEVNEEELTDYITPGQLSEELVTLSMLPDSRWKNLVNLDLIKLRNKPKEPPKKPKAAPFFLPSVAGLETKFDIQKDDEKAENVDKSRILSNKNFESNSILLRILAKDPETCTPLVELLKEMGPSDIEAEFRMLGPEMNGTIDGLVDLFKAFVILLKSGKYYELVQAYITLFLKLHGDLVPKHEGLRQQAEELITVIDDTWQDCQKLLHQSTCLVKYFKSATV